MSRRGRSRAGGRLSVAVVVLVGLITGSGVAGADDLSALNSRDRETMARAKVDYLLHCGGCHLPDAQGAPPNVPTLLGLDKIVSSPVGRDYIARVPGAAQVPISDQALADVFNWILLTITDGDFEPLTAAEVGNSRHRVLADPVGYRQQFWPDLPTH